jgi:sugar-specific transcriptional regulator TrmB
MEHSEELIGKSLKS